MEATTAEFKIVGSSFRGDFIQQEIYPRIAVGAVGFLAKEPSNQHDPEAIQVVVLDPETGNFWAVGYVPKGSGYAIEHGHDHAAFEVVRTGKGGKFLKVTHAIPRGWDAGRFVRDLVK